MAQHFPDRRRYIRSRAELEFQLARITLALTRAPIARAPDLREWFDEAAGGLVERAAPEHREHVEERAASIRETFFGTAEADGRQRSVTTASHGHGRDGRRAGAPRLH